MVAVEKTVAVVMQEGGRRALFDATQRLGANYREKAGLIISSDSGQEDACNCTLIIIVGARQIAFLASFHFFLLP